MLESNHLGDKDVFMEAISGETLRIIDANINRAGEGLRFLEEIVRFVLDDATLSQQLKNMRHETLRVDSALHQNMLQFRNSEGDVGVNAEVPADDKQREMSTAVTANARRVEESLRVLEELAKVPDIQLNPEKLEHARFQIYTIEKNLVSRLLRRDKIQNLTGLYLILDTEALKGRSHIEVTGQAIRGGAKVIQLRDKVSHKKELLPVAKELKKLCAAHNVLFIINDHLDLTLAVNADGLHVGQEDLPLIEARKLLPVDKILGGSARTADQAVLAQSSGADYIGVGSMYPTTSKDDTEVVGVERLRQIKQAVTVPLVAIGGINKDNVAQVKAAAADAAAVISAVLGVADIEKAAREIVNKIRGE